MYRYRREEDKGNSIGYMLRRNCLLQDAFEGQITKVKKQEEEEEEEERRSLVICHTEEDTWSKRRKLKIKKLERTVYDNISEKHMFFFRSPGPDNKQHIQ